MPELLFGWCRTCGKGLRDLTEAHQGVCWRCEGAMSARAVVGWCVVGACLWGVAFYTLFR